MHICERCFCTSEWAVELPKLSTVWSMAGIPEASMHVCSLYTHVLRIYRTIVPVVRDNLMWFSALDLSPHGRQHSKAGRLLSTAFCDSDPPGSVQSVTA